ncbi:hypothetical protein [Novosphingobium sp.]|uniref:hypothetical protein n=1 Tax=Novosphingobium sp. TaxID=1874826 RepID=UPI00286AF4A4|nr:hypothetical protein [Novosphingobium sp.]
MKHSVLIASATGLSLTLVSPVLAQSHAGHDMSSMPGMEMPPAPTPPPAPAPAPEDEEPADQTGYGHRIDRPQDMPLAIDRIEDQFQPGSGTSRLPGREGMMHGVHLMSGDWMFMVHGQASLQYTDHKGPRGDDMTYVTSMAMATAERQTDWGGIRFSAMTSLEPAMDARGYPNLFATGETAGGVPLVDRQHPHDLFMELSARVDVNLGRGRLFLYGGPVGEPALGPSAFMHRGSASNNPEPPITHHWFDSTHITYGVVTLGYSAPKWQIEASAFRGREPDEARWNIETPKLDSWAVRATFNPSPSWSLQASYGELKEPEPLHPGEDEQRVTTSVHYANGKGLSAMGAFSRKGHDGDNHNAWLGEANWDIDPRNSLFGRAENVDNGELFPDPLDPLHDQHFSVTKFQAGYARHVPLGLFDLSLGGSANLYAKPDALDAAYGDNPWGYTVFVRLKLGN